MVTPGPTRDGGDSLAKSQDFQILFQILAPGLVSAAGHNNSKLARAGIKISVCNGKQKEPAR